MFCERHLLAAACIFALLATKAYSQTRVPNPGNGPDIYLDWDDTHSWAGGAIFNFNGAQPMIDKSKFLGNFAFGFGGAAIGNWHAGAIVTNSTFAGNILGLGSGTAIYNYDSTTEAFNSTFSGNFVGSGFGSAVANENESTFLATNSIIHGSFADSVDQVLNDATSIAIIESSNVEGGWPGLGNFDIPPMFVRSAGPGTDGEWSTLDDDFGDLRLQPGSPCINAGDPDYVPAPGETDLDGHARMLCGRVDMGAYEFGIGDYDCDQSVNLIDVAAMQACFTSDSGEPYSAGCESLDFELDGDVDALDLTTFSEILTDP